MSRLQASFYLGVRDFLVAAELLGSEYEIERGARLLRIRLPKTEPPRKETKEPSGTELDQLFGVQEAEKVKGPPATGLTIGSMRDETVAHLSVLRVEVEFSHAACASDFEGIEPKSSEHFRPLYRTFEDCYQEAKDAVADLLAWARTETRQYWLGLGGEELEGLGRAELIDLDASLQLPLTLSLRPDLVIHRVGEEQILEKDGITRHIKAINGCMAPSLPDNLLADARYLAQHSEPPDPPRAMLAAAIATELRAKEILRSDADQGQRKLVELLLENPRDWSMAAAALLDKPMKIVLGTSLRDDDRDLYKGIDTLFQRRNSLVHRGVLPSKEEAFEGIQAAGRAFRWLGAKSSSGAEAS